MDAKSKNPTKNNFNGGCFTTREIFYFISNFVIHKQLIKMRQL